MFWAVIRRDSVYLKRFSLCKKFKFDHTNKLYMHNPEYVLENRNHIILWDFEIQMDYLISIRPPNQVIVNKKKREL